MSYFLDEFHGNVRLRLDSQDSYGVLIGEREDSIIYEDEKGTSVVSLSSIPCQTRFSELSNGEIRKLLDHVNERNSRSLSFADAYNLRGLERKLLQEGALARGAA